MNIVTACRDLATRLITDPRRVGVECHIRGNPNSCYRRGVCDNVPRVTIELWGLTEEQGRAVLGALADLHERKGAN